MKKNQKERTLNGYEDTGKIDEDEGMKDKETERGQGQK